MDHMTAKVSCFARAFHHRHYPVHVFDDSVAENLLGEDYDLIARNFSHGIKFFFPDFCGSDEEGLATIVEKQLAPSVLARSAFCENMLVEHMENGCHQYLVFGSGYDTYAIRNKEKQLVVYELDLPEMISDKKRRIESAKLQSDASYIPCDLSEAKWQSQLLKCGFVSDRKTFCSLSGISYYLTKDAFQTLLRSVSDICPAGSVICLDYPSPDDSLESRINRSLAQGAGEKMQSQYAVEEMKEIMEACRFHVCDHLDSEAMTERYFSTYNRQCPEHVMEAPGGVYYMLAEKY